MQADQDMTEEIKLILEEQDMEGIEEIKVSFEELEDV